MSWDVGAGLEGRGVVCTGAAGGIGRAVALDLAAAGAHVIAVARTESKLDQLVEEGHAIPVARVAAMHAGKRRAAARRAAEQTER